MGKKNTGLLLMVIEHDPLSLPGETPQIPTISNKLNSQSYCFILKQVKNQIKSFKKPIIACF